IRPNFYESVTRQEILVSRLSGNANAFQQQFRQEPRQSMQSRCTKKAMSRFTTLSVVVHVSPPEQAS
ncbi:hypothetical protein ACPXAM_24640, partial [Escherichia coli]|uniref:hypothetical protein n=1 Tax=Escherichia coli TaxID=562 RepID=UPI003CE506D2